MPVVVLVEDDHLVACRPQSLDIVRRVVDVEVGFHFRLGAEEAQIAVGDVGPVQPFNRVASGNLMAPVDVQTVCDDANPHSGIGQPPQRLGGSLDHLQVPEHSAFGDCVSVVVFEVVRTESPLFKVPSSFQSQRLFRYFEPFGDNPTKAAGVFRANAVEVDAEHEDFGQGQVSGGGHAAVGVDDGAVDVGCFSRRQEGE